MNVYQTDKNGVFVGVTSADQDPLDSSRWLIPAGCVETPPPACAEEQFALWNGSSWSVEDIEIIEPDPAEEPPTQEELCRGERNNLLAVSDWTQLADAPVDKDAWASYRSLLRHVPQQEGFPTEFIWPTAPE